MGTFNHRQRKSSTGSTPATPTSHWLRSSRPFAPALVPTPEQVSPNQQTQPTHSTRFKYSLADIPIFPPERENRTGLPDDLKAGIENLSGMAMADVSVHYNSSKPAEVQALAYTHGTEIHVGPGQEQHLAHEAWHVVQQKQGRVRPTVQVGNININDSPGLEQEATQMGEKATDCKIPFVSIHAPVQTKSTDQQTPIQRNGDGKRLSELAKDIIAGTKDIHDETLGLSEGQRQALEAMLLQLRMLERIERELKEFERQQKEFERLQQAMLPPLIPLEDFLVELQPDFNALASHINNPELESALINKKRSFGELKCSPRAAEKLRELLGTGLKPASKLGKLAVTSGDEKVNKIVCVNVLPPTRREIEARKRSAEFATYNKAGGAIPIAIEKAGDEKHLPTVEILTQRAMDSAVLIIDPAKLSVEQQSQVMGRSGELGLDSVPSTSIVSVLAPAVLATHLNLELIERFHIHFVGITRAPVFYAGTGKEVEIDHPDYKSALTAIFAANPNKTLLTHTTRLGPIKEKEVKKPASTSGKMSKSRAEERTGDIPATNIQVGTLVLIEHNRNVWTVARVTSIEGSNAKVEYPGGGAHWTEPIAELKLAPPGKQEGERYPKGASE